MIANLVLAAGGSSRLGRPKQLEPWGEGTTLLGKVLENALAMGSEETWVVLGAAHDEILARTDFSGCRVVINHEWEEGLAGSLRAGLDALERGSRVSGALVLLGDQPGVNPETVARLRQAYRPGVTPAVVPRYRYVVSNPVLVDRVLWRRLMMLEGDRGAMQLLKAHPEWVTEVWFADLHPEDVDDQQDVERLRPRGLARGGEKFQVGESLVATDKE
ncbi:MAG: nucleotidyltransferase family protein [bacterium]|nr:nucleotidyltransferase family protein [bacterium]MDE0500144.1 nucleotidyltransferase family protein [bacterium]